MLRLGTGDPALDYLRLSNLPPTPEMLASTRTMLGLDQPLYVQYGTWLWKALHLDFGISFASQRPVLDDMLNFLPATLELAGAALVLILLTSVPLGIWAARHTARYLGGAPPRSFAGFRRALYRVSWRVDAQLLAGIFASDGVFGVSAMATRDGLRRLAAHHFACGFHRLYVAGD